MNTCSFIIHFKKLNVCSKVFVEYMFCYGELKEASSSSSSPQLAPLVSEASPNTKKLKRTCFESFRYLTLWAPETLDLLVALIP